MFESPAKGGYLAGEANGQTLGIALLLHHRLEMDKPLPTITTTRATAKGRVASRLPRAVVTAARSQRPRRSGDVQARAGGRGDRDQGGLREGGVFEEALYGDKSKGREAIFTNISPVYDILNDGLSLGLHRRWKRRVVKLSECTTGDRALDVCCGSGDIAFRLSRAVGSEGHVSALDFSSDMLSYAVQRSVAKRLLRNERAATISWVHGDALELPFEDEEFDGVTIGYGLRNVADRDLCLREVHRVLKREKKAVILDFNSPKETKQYINRFRNFCLDTFVVPTATLCGFRCVRHCLAPPPSPPAISLRAH